MTEVNVYLGKELELFEHATTWKHYFASYIKPCLTGDILEVGAGIGSTTKILCDGNQSKWLCLEPDPNLADAITSLINVKELPAYCSVKNGTLKDCEPNKLFDAILYIDVLEHIEDAEEEIKLANKYLKSGGSLIILVPAHQWLFSEFDKAIGHFRRYNKSSLRRIIPPLFATTTLRYLDGVGVLASAMNKLFLKKSYPTKNDIYFWDNYIVPISKRTDFINHTFMGKSLLGIWKKPLG